MLFNWFCYAQPRGDRHVVWSACESVRAWVESQDPDSWTRLGPELFSEQGGTWTVTPRLLVDMSLRFSQT